MSPSLVSVVIPTFKRPQLLKCALASVLGQADSALEILVVDDGGQDEAREAADSFGDPRIRYLRNASPQGPAAARNVGLRSSSGGFIAFLDDDDEWLEGKVARQLAAFAADPRLLLVGTDRITFPERNRSRELSLRSDRIVSYRDLLRRCTIVNSSAMIRREAIDLIGYLDESVYAVEDYDYWLRILAARDRSALILRDRLVRYRRHAANITREHSLLERLRREYERLQPVYRKHLAYDRRYVESILESKRRKIEYLEALGEHRAGRLSAMGLVLAPRLSTAYRLRAIFKMVLRSR